MRWLKAFGGPESDTAMDRLVASSSAAVETTRLKLVPKTVEEVLARIERMPADERAQLSPAWLAQVQSPAVDVWTLGFDIVDRSTDAVVGGCGFKGPPGDDGTVEIAYWVDERQRGKGYATEAAAGLVDYAVRSSRVRLVRAHTLPEANASTRVLTKCGFRHLGEVVDPEDGLVWRWDIERSNRPFYSEYAWAFDLIIDRPVRKECAAIATWLIERGVRPGSTLLDAGCGTGRYASELARRGYVVHGIDLSPDLIAVARAAADPGPGSVSFTVGDLLAPPVDRYDAVLCRGVLNDILDDDRREAAMAGFARALRPDGALILDVREWIASAERKAREPLFRKRVSTDRGELTFTSVTALNRQSRLLEISERHELVSNGEARVSDYQFVMRCWARDELSERLARHGFGDAAYFGAYDPGVEAGVTDRVVAVACRSSAAAIG
jgi:RimJ/RimL family protein N-acetyltransferase/protein-L-isoaspartate O-methyltransferase